MPDTTSLSVLYLVVSIRCFPQAAQLFIRIPEQLKHSEDKSWAVNELLKQGNERDRAETKIS